MSAPTTVVAPSGSTAMATPLKGGALALTPASVGGRRRSRKMSKKAKKALKALKKMGGDELEAAVAPTAGADPMAAPVEGARRRRKSRRGSRKSRKGGLFY